MSALFDEDDKGDLEHDASTNDSIDLTHLSAEARDLLRSTVHRVEDIEAERATLAEDVKDLIAGAKLKGLTPKMIRKVIARRKMDPATREAEDTLLELYEGVFQ